jgi:secondary thiamine-phosphate synthase enzyme
MIRQHIDSLTVTAPRQGLHEISDEVESWLETSGIATGLLTLFCKHSSASLLIQENAAPAARSDLEAFFARIAPESSSDYEHDDEGLDDMPAHLRTALTQTSLSIPVQHGRMTLGTWQGLYLFEHRQRPQERWLMLHLIGESSSG